MNIDAWQAAAAIGVTAATVGTASRWWHLRRLDELARQLLKLDATHQNSLRMSAQARKQVEDLQRLVAEYRRRLTAADLAGRRQAHAAPRTVPDEAALPHVAPVARPGGWADTQPL